MSTIVSLATGNINCAIHIIRISGPESFEMINRVTKKRILRKGYEIQRATIYENDEKVDDVLILKYIAPNSYTGEDVVEICCHGSYFIAKKIINILLSEGCQLSSKGEFTKRAYLNNKINLIQAQSIDNLIRSQSNLSLKLANVGMSNQMKEKIENFKEAIFQLLGNLEVSIDYPEYDIENKQELNKLVNKVRNVQNEIEKTIQDSKAVIPIRDNFKIVIIGKPNVGKSSLLNLLTKSDKAIVSKIPGTTRDFITAKIDLNGIVVDLIDTAGIHSNYKGAIEKQGILRSKDQIKKADLILLVLDGSKKLDKNDQKLINTIKKRPHIIAVNKSDLKKVVKIDNAIWISVKNNNIDQLKKALINHLNFANIDWDKGIFLQSNHEISLMEQVHKNIDLFLKEFSKSVSIDLIINYLKTAYERLLELLGESQNTNFIDEIFKHFCVGK